MRDDNEERRDDSSSKAPNLQPALRFYMLGFTLLGGAVGFFAGASKSPVIGTLLPLLFGLVGGAGGLYLTRVDLYDRKTLLRLSLLGKSLSLFIVFAVIGSVYGISLRTQRSIWSFLSFDILMPKSEAELPLSVQEDPRKTLQLVLLRARIRALGATVEEEKHILQQSARLAEAKNYASDANASLIRLANLAKKSIDVMGKDYLASKAEGSPPEGISHLRVYLRAYAADFQEWADRLANGDKIPLAFVLQRIDGLRETIEKLLYGYKGAFGWLSKHDLSRQQIWELQWTLINEKQSLGTFEWLGGGGVGEEADRFLAIFFGGGSTGEEANLPWKLPTIGYER